MLPDPTIAAVTLRTRTPHYSRAVRIAAGAPFAKACVPLSGLPR